MTDHHPDAADRDAMAEAMAKAMRDRNGNPDAEWDDFLPYAHAALDGLRDEGYEPVRVGEPPRWMADELPNQGVGNCGFIDPLNSVFEDGDKAPPWWVPLAPAEPITECQAWANFVRVMCEPARVWAWSGGKSRYTAEGERWWNLAYDVTTEFACLPTSIGEGEGNG